MKRGSSRALALGAAALVASWAFGSTPFAVAGLGFVLAGLLARGWSRALGRAPDAERRILPGERVEGGELVVEVQTRLPRLLGGAIVVKQQLGDLRGEGRVRRSRCQVVFTDIHRGRHELEPLEMVMSDPLGLDQVVQRLGEPRVILIRPRVPLLESVFTTHGARDAGAARSLFRRPTGFEIHAIRDYTPGEPLRAVHWPSTARSGRLMVKELDDSPRDDLAVVLDQDLEGVAGPRGASSFDAAVRAAGAIALAHVRWNRRVVLVGTAAATADVTIRSSGHDWELALDMLAAVTPEPGALVDRALRAPSTGLSRAREIVVVTARPERATEPLLELRQSGRAVSLVVVAPETFAGRARTRPNAAVLRAAALGVPVAVIAADRPIEEALSGPFARVIGA